MNQNIEDTQPPYRPTTLVCVFKVFGPGNWVSNERSKCGACLCLQVSDLSMNLKSLWGFIIGHHTCFHCLRDQCFSPQKLYVLKMSLCVLAIVLWCSMNSIVWVYVSIFSIVFSVFLFVFFLLYIFCSSNRIKCCLICGSDSHYSHKSVSFLALLYVFGVYCLSVVNDIGVCVSLLYLLNRALKESVGKKKSKYREDDRKDWHIHSNNRIHWTSQNNRQNTKRHFQFT